MDLTQSGQPEDYEIGIFCVSATHATQRSQNKDWLTWNQDNVIKVA